MNYDRHEEYAQLSRRYMGVHEPLIQYLMLMQMIADIDERELTKFIIDGLQDRNPAAAMLYLTRNFQTLKDFCLFVVFLRA